MILKENIKKTCRVRNLIRFCLISLFLWWGTNAMMKYWNQPLSTDIRYRQEEAKPGNQFPLITLCNSRDFFGNPIIKDCVDGLSWDFIGTVVCCMKGNETSKEANFIQNLSLEKGNIVEMVRFWTGSKYISLWPLHEKVWTPVFLEELGPCYIFDLSKVDKIKYFPLYTKDTFGRPGIEFVMAEKNLWQTAKLLLHTKFDLPDAYQLRGYVPLSFSDNIKKALKVEIQKEINWRESTRKVPCVKYDRRTCQSIEKYLEIFEKFNCSMPILYSGQHLDNFIPKDISNCSDDITLEVLNFYMNKGSNCSMTQTCENVKFASSYKVEETWIEKKTLIYVVFESPEVEYHTTYISYGFYSLVGEIGGILGLTLGASAFTLSDFLLKHLPYY